MRGFNYKKSVQLLNLIASKSGGTVNKMKAIKLVWLADRLHLRLHGRTITGDTYFALPNGPVPSATRDFLEYKSFSLSDEELGYSSNFISPCHENRLSYKSVNEIDVKVFSKSEIEILERVWDGYGMYDQFDLRDISHEFPEWQRHKSALENKVYSRALMEMEDFFKTSTSKFDKTPVDEDILEESKEVFLQEKRITSLLR